MCNLAMPQPMICFNTSYSPASSWCSALTVLRFAVSVAGRTDSVKCQLVSPMCKTCAYCSTVVLIRLETAEWLTSGGKNVHCSLQYRGVKVASGDTGFVNSAGTAGPIRTGDGSFDAPERRNDDGGGHVAHVPRGTCHVPPREPFEKCCVRAAAQTGSGREPKLSGQKRLGLNCVSLEESAPRGQNCAPRGQFYCFQPSAL